MNRLKFLALATLLLSFTNFAFAQSYFEGNLTVVQSNKTTSEKSEIKVYVSPARIKIEGGEKKVDVKMLGTDDVSSVLIRLDNEDFVMFSSEMGNTALKVSKLDIENMMNMVKNMSKQFGGGNNEEVKEEPKVSIKRTKETKTISGYKASKIVVISPDEPNQETHIWMTKDLNINLGMLTDSWEFMDTLADGSSSWLKKGEFPLLLQTFKNGTLMSEVEVTKINKGKVNGDYLTVPDGIQLLSLQDMIMKKMMGN